MAGISLIGAANVAPGRRRPHGRWRRVGAMLGVLALAAMTLAVAPAAGFSRQGTTSCGQQVKFAFSGPHWVSGVHDTRPTLRTYIDDWEAEWNWNAAHRLLDTKESFGELVITYQPSSHFSDPNHPGGGTGTILGTRHQCTSIHINELYMPPSYPPPSGWYADMGKLLQHEIGHGFGFDHTGDDDSHEGATPIMSTCIGGFDNQSTKKIAQDDFQMGHYEHGTLNPESMTANVGFNRGTTYYAKTGGTSWFTGSGGVYWKPTTSGGGYFYQTSSVSESAQDWFDARINWKRTVAGLGGIVKVEMWARSVSYSGGSCSPSLFNSNVNQNGTRSLGSWVLKAANVVWNSGGVTSLTSLTTVQAKMYSQFVDIQIRGSHQMRYQSGAYIPLLFDNVRIRER